MIDEIKNETKELMEKAVVSIRTNLSKVRTGKATPQILEGISINYYGQSTALSQAARVSSPEAKLLQIQPFDKTLIPEIEKAIMAANLGVTPANDGNVVRLVFPPLTEDKRKELVKSVKKIGEEGKIVIRNIRRDENEKIKKIEKNKECSEDDAKKYQQAVQEVTDKFIQEVDKFVGEKEKDLLTV